MQIIDNTNHSFDAIKNYNPEIIIDFINSNFSEEEKINILRNKEFISIIPQDLLVLMLNNMSLISVLNMLQNKEILNKVDNINIKLMPKDNIFLLDCLNNKDLISKLNHNMIKNMLINIPKDKTIELLNQSYIATKLNMDDIINIALNKKIDLVNEYNVIEGLSKRNVINYINDYWKTSIKYSLLNNDYIKKILFNDSKLNLDEATYIFDYLITQSNHNAIEITKDLSAFKSCVAFSKIFGIQKCLALIYNNSLNLNSVRLLFKDVDISKITNYEKIQEFIKKNIKNYLVNNKDLIISLGTMINNFEDNFLSSGLKSINNYLINKYNIDSNINGIKDLINNEFDSNIKNIVFFITKKQEEMKNTPDVIVLNEDNFKTINNNDNINLSLDNTIDENNFIIKNDNNYIKCNINDNKVFIEINDDINKDIIIEIANKLLQFENFNYIIVKTNRKDINGIRLSSESNMDEIVIQKNIPIKSNTLLDNNKSKSK